MTELNLMISLQSKRVIRAGILLEEFRIFPPLNVISVRHQSGHHSERFSGSRTDQFVTETALNIQDNHTELASHSNLVCGLS